MVQPYLSFGCKFGKHQQPDGVNRVNLVFLGLAKQEVGGIVMWHKVRTESEGLWEGIHVKNSARPGEEERKSKTVFSDQEKVQFMAIILQ